MGDIPLAERRGLLKSLTMILVLVASALACNLAGVDNGQPSGDDITVTFFLDPTLLTLVPADTSTPDPAIPSPVPTETPTVTPGCGVWSEFVDDITIPDGSEIVAGGQFEKVWRLRNNGCLPWPAGTQLVFLSGDQMGGPDALDISPVQPGALIDISVPLVAPEAFGSYLGRWQLITPDGVSIGPYVFVQIVTVPPTATPTVTITPTGLLYDTVLPFLGNWINQDVEGRITRLQIREAGNLLYVSMWGRDQSGTEVYWGEVFTPSSDAIDHALILTWRGNENGGAADRVENQQLSLLPDGRMYIFASVDYTDPARQDLTQTDFFQRSAP
nr:hypothetical protein [Anaerolineae bacterium]